MMPGMTIVPAYPGITEIIWNEHTDFFIWMLVITVISSSSRLKRRSRPWMDRGRCPIIVSNSICTSAHAHWIFNPWPQYCDFLQQNPASRKCRQRFSLSWKLLMALVSWEFGQCHASAVCPVVDMFLSLRGDSKDLSWMALGCGFKTFSIFDPYLRKISKWTHVSQMG